MIMVKAATKTAFVATGLLLLAMLVWKVAFYAALGCLIAAGGLWVLEQVRR